MSVDVDINGYDMNYEYGLVDQVNDLYYRGKEEHAAPGKDVEEGKTILINDGTIELKVKEIVNKIIDVCPEFKGFLVPECIYRGNICHEFKSCEKMNFYMYS